MAKVEISALFYSKQNLDMAYELKRACREIGVSVIYAFEIPELVRFLSELNVEIIFIDCITLKMNDNIISFIKSYSSTKNSIIICIGDGKCCEMKNLTEVNYVINYANLYNELKQLENAITYNMAKPKNTDYDINEINSYVTNYLLSIGVAPKHLGFNFIKQAIELAIKSNGILGSLSREIYPTIANKNKTHAQNVERNIRNAIECACNSNELQKDSIKFLITNNKISNRAFLSYLLDKILNQYSHKK